MLFSVNGTTSVASLKRFADEKWFCGILPDIIWSLH
jgi:hypothetical protein